MILNETESLEALNTSSVDSIDFAVPCCISWIAGNDIADNTRSIKYVTESSRNDFFRISVVL